MKLSSVHVKPESHMINGAGFSGDAEGGEKTEAPKAAEEKPAEEAPKAEEAKPAEEAKATEEAKPAEEAAKPAE